MLLREAIALDRSIDRKVKILLPIRKEPVARTPVSGVRGSSKPSVVPSGRTKDEPQTATAAVCGTLLDAGTESPTEENPAEPSISPEQSQNVIENKGSGAAGVSA